MLKIGDRIRTTLGSYRDSNGQLVIMGWIYGTIGAIDHDNHNDTIYRVDYDEDGYDCHYAFELTKVDPEADELDLLMHDEPVDEVIIESVGMWTKYTRIDENIWGISYGSEQYYVCPVCGCIGVDHEGDCYTMDGNNVISDEWKYYTTEGVIADIRSTANFFHINPVGGNDDDDNSITIRAHKED